MELFKNESFKTFLEAKTLDAKMVALRDAGIVNNDIIKDEDLARTLMETISYSLQEDPNVQSKKPDINSTEGYGNIPYISKALKRRDDAMNPEGY